MLSLCTVCDKEYLLKGLAMHHSLCETIEGKWKLYWLCIDDDIYTELLRLNPKNVVPVRLADLEKRDHALRRAKNNPASKYGTQYSQYCWTLTPYFINYLLKKYIAKGEKIIYADSDIYFYRSPQAISDMTGRHSVGIHSHYPFGGTRTETDNGWYNVGVLVITKNLAGIQISDHWKRWLMNPDNEYYATYGTCGDQKYLELFEKIWGRDHVCVFDEEGGISHLAPWNSDNQQHPEHKFIMHNGKAQSVAFFHFSHFRHDAANDQWHDSLHGEWNPSKDVNIRRYYEEYFNVIKKVA